MIWTKNKPTIPGYYWLKMKYEEPGKPCSNQPPRVVLVGSHPEEPEDEMWALEGPDYDDGILVVNMDNDFDWSSDPISLPGEFCAEVETCCYAAQTILALQMREIFFRRGGMPRKAFDSEFLGGIGEYERKLAKREGITLEDKTPCGCRELDNEACSSCDSSIPLPR
jgi:hypothetical protein